MQVAVASLSASQLEMLEDQVLEFTSLPGIRDFLEAMK
jgi:hypothetical protein